MTFKAHLKIPCCPPALNAANKKHWSERNSDAEEWRMRVWAMIKRKELPAPPKTPLASARIQVIRHSSNMLDFDGVVGSMKPVIDALVKNGFILDDRWSVVGAWSVDQKYRPRKEGQLTEILIEESRPDEMASSSGPPACAT